jgi:hypothetical protein
MRQPETFALWAPNGELRYAQNLGETARQVSTLHAADGDHFLLLTSSRLLIWP